MVRSGESRKRRTLVVTGEGGGHIYLCMLLRRRVKPGWLDDPVPSQDVQYDGGDRT